MEPEQHLSTGSDRAIPVGILDHVARTNVADDHGIPDIDDVGVHVEFHRPTVDRRRAGVFDLHVAVEPGRPTTGLRIGQRNTTGCRDIVVDDSAGAGSREDRCPQS